MYFSATSIYLAFTLSLLYTTEAGPEYVPIGAIFDRQQGEMGNALNVEIHLHNRDKSTSFKLNANSQLFDDEVDGFLFSTTMCNQMQKGIFALLGTHNANTINTIKSFTGTFQMPYITPSMPFNTSGQMYGFEIYLQPLYSRALLSYMTYHKWKKAFYVYRDQDGLRRLEQLFNTIAAEDIQLEFDVKRVTSVTDLINTLQSIDKRMEGVEHRVVLDLPTATINDFFHKQEKKSLREARFHYFLAGLGINEINLENYKHGGINITGFRILDFQNATYSAWIEKALSMLQGKRQQHPRKITYQQALMADGVKALIKTLHSLQINQPHIFKSTLHTKKYRFHNNGSEGIDCDIGGIDSTVPWEHGSKIIKELKKIKFFGLTGQVEFDDFGLRKGYTLDLLEVTLHRGLAKIGSWHPVRGLKIGKARLIRPNKTMNSDKRTLIVTSILTEPYLMAKRNPPSPEVLKENPNAQYEGYCADLAKRVSQKVGFKYRIKPVKDGKYGAQDENATWNGMVGELVRNTDPYLMERNVSEDGKILEGNDRYHGYCADLAAIVAKRENFSYVIEIVHDNKYGEQDENGTWNGMVGALIRHEADMAIAPLTITSGREMVIDFSKPFMSLGISIMIKKPSKDGPGVFSFMYPLSYEIWMCVIFAYIGVSVVLFLVSRFSPFEWHIEDNGEGPEVTNNFTIFNSLWFSLGAFMQQGCDIEPRSVSGRIVGSVWWFFTLIIISSYTANLAAFLTVSRMQSPIRGAEDLARQTEIKYGTVDSGSTKNFFKTSTIAVYERMWAFMGSAEPPVFVDSNEGGVAKVRSSNGKYAFILESTTNDYINQRKPCDTMKVGNNLDSKGYGIATPMSSELRERLTLAVLELREKGELQKLKTKWWYDKGECGDNPKPSKGATNSLKLPNVAGIFFILVSGLGVALLMAITEFMYKSHNEARRKQTSLANAVRSKARLSIKGQLESQTVMTPDLGVSKSMSTYTYGPAAQLVSLDGFADSNTHTQV